MSLHVCAIEPDELPSWVDAMYVAFHTNRPVDPTAAYHRERLDGDTARCLAVFDGSRLVGTYESFATELTLPGSACLPANAVTAVSVLPTHHRRGALTSMLTQDMRVARERGDAVSVLIAAEYPIYGRFGFGPTTSHAAYRLETAHAHFVRDAPGRVDLVSPEALRQIAPDLFERVRSEYPGQIARRPFYWDTRLGLKPSPFRTPDQHPRLALYTASGGEPQGYAVYDAQSEWTHGVPHGKLQVDELQAITPDAYLGLWRYLADVDLVAEVTADMRRLDEPLAWLFTDARKAWRQTMRADFLWLRALDTPRLLQTRRYATEDRLVLQVDDPLGLAGGRFALQAGPHGATCRPTDAAADLSLSMSALGAISLGGVSLHMLHAAGRIQEERSGSLARAERLFHWSIPPWCSTFF